MFSPRASPAVGALFGTPDSSRRMVTGEIKSLHADEVKALKEFQLPAGLPVKPEELSHEYNVKQRDEPSVDSVWEAMNKAPASAP